jgi:AraC-like DNA-binding protein
VHFGADENSLAFSYAVLEQRAALANAEMFRYFDEHAEAELASLGRPEAFTDRVRCAVLDTLRAGVSSGASVARLLGMSERTLRRRLEESGCTFRDVLDQTRMTAADRLLSDPGRTITEVAYALGFSEPSAFSRAYRRHYGISPGRWRRQAANYRARRSLS